MKHRSSRYGWSINYGTLTLFPELYFITRQVRGRFNFTHRFCIALGANFFMFPKASKTQFTINTKVKIILNNCKSEVFNYIYSLLWSVTTSGETQAVFSLGTWRKSAGGIFILRLRIFFQFLERSRWQSRSDIYMYSLRDRNTKNVGGTPKERKSTIQWL